MQPVLLMEKPSSKRRRDRVPQLIHGKSRFDPNLPSQSSVFYKQNATSANSGCFSQGCEFLRCFHFFVQPKERPLQDGYLMLLLPFVSAMGGYKDRDRGTDSDGARNR